MIDPTFCRSGTGVWRRLYKKLGRPHFDPINRGSNKGSKKFEILKFELGEKLDHHFKVKFHGESNGDGPDVQKRCLDPEMGHKGLVGAKNHKNLKFELGEKLDH